MNKLISLAAATYAGIGVVSFLRPEMVPALFGGTAPTADARTEIRAVYGGLPLAIAGTLVVRPSSAAAMGVVSAGMAAGRAASVAVEGEEPSGMTKLWLGIEAGLAAVLFAGAAGRGVRRAAGRAAGRVRSAG